MLALYKYPRPYVAICLMRPTLRALLGFASLKLSLALYKISWAIGVFEGYTGHIHKISWALGVEGYTGPIVG